ncbi:MAG TPA: HD domain-containing protein [Actinophytocola sp.]|uniref:HD domain-containing protein n=1 Tax=Actinophytocola sp. TaxID=1872138 RepID=UPI002DDD2491|nr:HD domain-containing protein [Actinophytocola sp.]HEV2780118.1 HD domain-containing protein [Actinophytocola sp.]
MSGRRDVPLIFEIGTLRHLARTWRQFGGLDLSNVAEHSFRVAWISLILASREGADVGRCVLMALLHDVPETRTGDVNYIHRMNTVRLEDHALTDALVDTTAGPELQDIWREWTLKKTLESQVVRDADSLDCDFELREQHDRGARLPAVLAPTRQAVRRRLHTKSARLMFDEIQTSDPHEWHLAARNRLTAGDWAESRAQ